MEDGTSPSSSSSSPNISDSIIDFSLVNDLLYDGFWLEAAATDASTSFCQPLPDSDTNQHEPKSLVEDGFSQDQESTRLWVGPNQSPSVTERLVQAINCLQDSVARDKDVLIQIWVPVKAQGRQVLTTNNLPFSLSPNCTNLASYRGVSESYQFEASDNSTEFLGLPGRVFLNRSPEWTPDVRFFRGEEYPRVEHAQVYDVRGSLALPVFEQGSGICLGVVEIVTTHQKLDFHPELDSVCKALQAVHLESSNIQNPYNVEDGDEAYQGTQTEIRNVLKLVCDKHRLPLAQVWSSCLDQRKGGCRNSDESYTTRCVSIMESACYVADAQVTGFHEACCQHHLLKGEGVAGKAFLTNQPCFSEDITVFSKTQYPLAHHARLFGLCASAAIRLRITSDGTADFVLEFFLPPNCRGTEDLMAIIQSLSSVMQQNCQRLRLITDEELAQEISTGDRWQKISTMTEKGKGVIVSLDDGQLPQPPKSSAAEGGSFSLANGNLPSGSKANSAKKKKKKKKKANKAISLEVLRQYFAGSLKEAAKNIGVCPTTLKRICRQHGITRWPSRKIKKVSHSLRKLQHVIDSVQVADGSIQLSSFYNHFPELDIPGSSNLLTGGDLQQVKDQAEGVFAPTTLKSPSSSGSHSSGSSYCWSTGVKQSSLPGEQTGMLKKARSDAELSEKGREKMKPFIRSYSHKLFSSHSPTNASAKPETSNQGHHGSFRVKAAFGEEKIRLSLQPQWGLKDLRKEILGRFNVDDGSVVNLKYLDDDAEWVLLTCDDDLEECRDIHTASNSPTIKLSLNRPNPVGSLGSN